MVNNRLTKIRLVAEMLILIVVTVVPYVPVAVKIVISAILCICSIVAGLRKNGAFRLELPFVLIMLFFAVTAILDVRNVTAKEGYSIANLMYPFYFICGYFCAQNWDKEELYETLEKVIFVLALLSFVGMAIMLLAPAVVLRFPAYEYNGLTHRTIYIANFLFRDNWMLVRNSGITWEPGVFQILLNIALQVAIQNKKGKSLFIRVLVYTLAIVLTRSTMGYMVLAINLVSLILKDRRYIALMVGAALACAPFIAEELIYQLENKLAGSSSFSARYDPMINALRYAWYRPFGIGSTRYNLEYEALGLGSYDSYTQILLRYGFATLLCVFERMFKIFRDDSKWMCLILLISFFSEPVWGLLLFVVLFYVKENDRRVKVSGEEFPDTPEEKL